MTTGSTVLKVIVVIFAIIGLFAVVGLFGMGLMHASMMNMGGMGQRMAAMCSNMMTAHP